MQLGAIDRPAVILTASEDIGEGQDLGLLSIMAQISEPVIGFDRLRIKARMTGALLMSLALSRIHQILTLLLDHHPSTAFQTLTSDFFNVFFCCLPCAVQVEGGTVASVNKLTGIGAGKGEMYTIAIVPDTGAGAGHRLSNFRSHLRLPSLL